METFGNRLRLLREAKGLRQEDIGDIFGFGKSTISQWEKGTREPDFSVVVKLAEYFQVSTDDLLGKKLPVSYVFLKKFFDFYTPENAKSRGLVPGLII